MNLLKKDYRKLYLLQDKFLRWWINLGLPVYFELLDTPRNILSNKLTAILSRDEPKDIFDIVHIALNYSFNWQAIFDDAKQKSAINEIDIEERLCSFPPEMFKSIDWNIVPVDNEFFSKTLRRIADDFLLGRDNSLCQIINPLSEAKPL